GAGGGSQIVTRNHREMIEGAGRQTGDAIADGIIGALRRQADKIVNKMVVVGRQAVGKKVIIKSRRPGVDQSIERGGVGCDLGRWKRGSRRQSWDEKCEVLAVVCSGTVRGHDAKMIGYERRH